jgi:uncharacterized protein
MTTPHSRTDAGAPIWLDLMCSDVPASQAFYASVMGWEAGASSEEFGGYFMYFRDGHQVAGSMPGDARTPGVDQWRVYVGSRDAAASCERAVAAGGAVILPPMPVADMGVMAVIADAHGITTGIWQPESHEGFALHGQAWSPAWFEIRTRDFDAALDFARTVFGWTLEMMPGGEGFRYATAMNGGEPIAGIFAVGQDDVTGWSTYLAVDDTDAAATRAAAAGGTVTGPVVDTPFGRMADVSDPTGATLRLIQSQS